MSEEKRLESGYQKVYAILWNFESHDGAKWNHISSVYTTYERALEVAESIKGITDPDYVKTKKYEIKEFLVFN